MFPKRKGTKNISIYQVFMKKNAKSTEITLQMFMLITAELQIWADGSVLANYALPPKILLFWQ